MSNYIVLLNWTQGGIDNIKDSPSRLDRAKEGLKEIGGKLKGFYLTMGSYDMVIVCEAPDDAAMAKYVLTLDSAGSVRSETLRAFPEDEYREIIESLP